MGKCQDKSIKKRLKDTYDKGKHKRSSRRGESAGGTRSKAFRDSSSSQIGLDCRVVAVPNEQKKGSFSEKWREKRKEIAERRKL